MNLELMSSRKRISLRGLWKGFVIKDEDVDEAKFVWFGRRGLKNKNLRGEIWEQTF